MDVEKYVQALSDDDLLTAFFVAKNDLADAAIEKANSEWHESCFAGVMVIMHEINRRDKLSKVIH